MEKMILAGAHPDFLEWMVRYLGRGAGIPLKRYLKVMINRLPEWAQSDARKLLRDSRL